MADAEGLVGRTVNGRFRIDRILGRGGMATVYAAFDNERGSPVALKVLKPELSRDSMVLKRFAREAKAASHLQHPNVVQVLDWGTEGDEAFIAMELAQGTDLLKALSKQRPMKQTRAVLVLSQVCAALSAAHGKGIIHRDLKPENILLVADPTEVGGERAKVLDFGIAKILDVSKSASNSDDPPSYVTKTALTRVGTIVGTPAYMSPEQCRGGEIDGRSDVYACGVLLYQLVTGELPFTGETPLHTAMRHIHAPARAPSELRRDLAPALERVIVKALAKWPGERQQSADQLRDELLATLPHLPDRSEFVLPADLGAAPAPATRSAPPRAIEPAPVAKPAIVQPPIDRKDPRRETSSPDIGAKPAPAESTANGGAAEVDVTNPTRQVVGGPLGATPLRAVRLIRGETGQESAANPATDGPASEGPATSLAPHTTHPEEVPPSSDLDDEARTGVVDWDDEDSAAPTGSSAAPATTQDPVITPRTSDEPRAANEPTYPPRVEVKVKTDPIEQAKAASARASSPTLVNAPSAPEPNPPARSKTGPMAPAAERVVAKTDRTPPRAGAPPIAPIPAALKPKPSQTNLTPVSPKVDAPVPRPQGMQGLAAAPLASAAAAQANAIAVRSASPQPSPQVQPAAGMGTSPMQPTATAPAGPMMPQPHAITSHRPSTPPEPPDDDEPPTHIREPASLPLDRPQPMAQGKTLVMEPSANPLAVGSTSGSFNLDDGFRGLKSTARIGAEDPQDRATNPLQYAQTGENLQGVKATMRMSPAEQVNPSHRAAPLPAAGMPPPQGMNRMAQQQPQPQMPVAPAQPMTDSSRLDPQQVNTNYRQLQAGNWNEPTVVKRNPRVKPKQKEGIVSLLSDLSGTTGMLIGIGLGLGLAAGLLITYLLLR